MSNKNIPSTGFHTNPERINRKGAPKKEWTWAGLIRDAMERRNLDGESVKEAVADVLVGKAMEGDVAALKELGNRLDGLPKQSIEHSSDVDKPLRIVVVEDKGLGEE